MGILSFIGTILVSLASIAVIILVAYVIRDGKEEIAEKPKEEKAKGKLSEKDKKKLEEAKKAFDNLMRYDYDEVIKRK